MGIPVIQKWVSNLTFMQQSVLMAAVRGPDGIRKDHVVKVLLRWFRRCVLLSAFDGKPLLDPYAEGGGSFTGPLPPDMTLQQAVDAYLRHIDELPHHFQLHFMHAAEILGYKFPIGRNIPFHNINSGDKKKQTWWSIRQFWNYFYMCIVNDAHLHPETEEQMDYRLGDIEKNWRGAENCVASGSGSWKAGDKTPEWIPCRFLATCGNCWSNTKCSQDRQNDHASWLTEARILHGLTCRKSVLCLDCDSAPDCPRGMSEEHMDWIVGNQPKEWIPCRGIIICEKCIENDMCEAERKKEHTEWADKKFKKQG